MKIDKMDVPFTQVANVVLNDKNLSWKAKGIFGYIYSKPPNYDFSTDRMKNDSTDGLDSLRSGVKELEDLGYLKRKRKPDGRVDYEITYKASVGKSNMGKTPSGKTQQVSNTDTNSNTYKNIAGASPASAKPKPKAKKPVIELTPEMLEERLTEMEKDEGSYLDIIATYIRQKPVKIENSAQLSLTISRFSRIAKQSEGAYKTDQIFKAIKIIKAENAERKRKGESEVDWTVETIVKKLIKM